MSQGDTTSNRKRRSHIKAVDSYGFIMEKEEAEKQLQLMNTAEHKAKIRKQNERLQKWLFMIENWDTFHTGNRQSKLKSRIRKGIPSAVRSKVWIKLAGVDIAMKAKPTYYKSIVGKRPDNKWATVIEKDLDRTFPKHNLFVEETSAGQDQLRNVLYAYACHDREVGYCQGMGFICALMLMLMTEEEAFWMMVRLLEDNGNYQLRGIFLDGLPLLHMRYFQFSRLLYRFDPVVSQHLKQLGIIPELYTSKWFITIFCYDFPFDCVLRFWDCYLSEGIKFVFRAGVGLIKTRQKEILASNFEGAMKIVQTLSDYVDTEDAMTAAFNLKIKHEHLNEATLAYRGFKKKQDKLAAKRKQERAERAAARAAAADNVEAKPAVAPSHPNPSTAAALQQTKETTQTQPQISDENSDDDSIVIVSVDESKEDSAQRIIVTSETGANIDPSAAALQLDLRSHSVAVEEYLLDETSDVVTPRSRFRSSADSPRGFMPDNKS